jgi:hypothetical protein
MRMGHDPESKSKDLFVLERVIVVARVGGQRGTGHRA